MKTMPQGSVSPAAALGALQSLGLYPSPALPPRPSNVPGSLPWFPQQNSLPLAISHALLAFTCLRP